MPHLDVRVCSSGSEALSREIAASLTDLTATVLRKKRELTAVAVEYVAASEWFIGGAVASSRPTFYLNIKVTEGTNTSEEKSSYVARVFAAMQALLGELHPASYIVIQEVPSDSWGYGGLTQAFRAADEKKTQPPVAHR